MAVNVFILERDLDINRGNKKLLEKLVEISKGKHVRKFKPCLITNGGYFSFLWSL